MEHKDEQYEKYITELEKAIELNNERLLKKLGEECDWDVEGVNDIKSSMDKLEGEKEMDSYLRKLLDEHKITLEEYFKLVYNE